MYPFLSWMAWAYRQPRPAVADREPGHRSGLFGPPGPVPRIRLRSTPSLREQDIRIEQGGWWQPRRSETVVLGEPLLERYASPRASLERTEDEAIGAVSFGGGITGAFDCVGTPSPTGL